MKWFLCMVFLLVLTVSTSLAHAQDFGDAPVPSHCAPNEQIIFTCSMQRGGKHLSVCASPQLSWLQYRFGALGKVELAYPAQKAGSVNAFQYWRYTRPRVTYLGLSFQRRGARYEVYDEFSTEEGSRFMAQGVRVFMPSGKEADLPCGQLFISRLMDLEHVVPNKEWR